MNYQLNNIIDAGVLTAIGQKPWIYLSFPNGTLEITITRYTSSALRKLANDADHATSSLAVLLDSDMMEELL